MNAELRGRPSENSLIKKEFGEGAVCLRVTMSLTLEMKCICVKSGKEKRKNFGPSRGSEALRLLATGFMYAVL